MGRTPFHSAPTLQQTPPVNAVALRGQTAATARPAMRDLPEPRTLVVGRGISLQGTVQDAERLVVEGTVEATLIHATELSISHGGVFKGEIEVEDAEIAGMIDGTLTVRANLIVRASGRVLGTARCRRLQVEDGGQITGRIEMISEGWTPVEQPKPTASPSSQPQPPSSQLPSSQPPSGQPGWAHETADSTSV